jgi:hypothetical protein
MVWQQPLQDNRDRTAGKGQPGQVGLTGQLGQKGQHMTARTTEDYRERKIILNAGMPDLSAFGQSGTGVKKC